MIDIKIIGERIKTYRENKEITQQEMVNELKSKDCIMSRETLSKIENGNRNISAIELTEICNILGIRVEDMLADSDDDDLVTLFRKRKTVSEEALTQIEEIQNIIISFINQKSIVKKGKFANNSSMWKE